jgi:hypothetical protein
MTMNSADAAPPDAKGPDAPMKPVAFSNPPDVPPGWSVPWPDPPSAQDERFDRLVGILTATFTLAGVSLLAVWLWTPAQSAGRDAVTASASTRRNTAGRQNTTLAPAPDRGTRGSVQETAELRTRLAPSGGVAPAAVLARDERRRDPRPDTNSNAGYDQRAALQGRTAGLLVLSQPLGARVTINGVGYGTTPARIPYLPAGPKRIRVTMDGYDTEERFFGAETSMSHATLRIVMRETPTNRRGTDAVRDLEPSERPR